MILRYTDSTYSKYYSLQYIRVGYSFKSSSLLFGDFTSPDFDFGSFFVKKGSFDLQNYQTHSRIYLDFEFSLVTLVIGIEGNK